MSSSKHHVVKPFTCRCRNVTINASDIAPDASNDEYERVFVGEDGIRIVHPCLTSRTREHAAKSSEKSVQRLTLHCLECNTRTYRIVQDILPGLEAREGPVTPNDGWVEQDIMISRSGWIEVLLGPNGCLAGINAIETHFRDLKISDTFSIAIPSDPSSHSSIFSTPSHPRPMQGSDDTHQTLISLNMPSLSELAPLFPPPPFTPSHAVFQLLSTHATSKSAEWRVTKEAFIRDFFKKQLCDLQRREEDLRLEVEAIWRNYRAAWKEIMSQVSESRPGTGIRNDSPSQSSRKASIPVSIRDFSPINPPETSDTPHSPSNCDTLSFPISSPVTSTSSIRNRPVFGSLNSMSPSVAHFLSPNEVNPVKEHGQLSVSGDRGELLMSAFKRNMDTSFDIATSLRWAEGEEALRKRFETKNEDHRARNRTSKSLDITSGNVMPEAEPLPSEQTEASIKVKASEDQKGKTKKHKRRVTFDIKSDETSNSAPAQVNAPFTEELFDLDDFLAETLSSSIKDKPVSRNPTYKMHQNLNGKEPQETRATSLPTSISKPFSSLHAETPLNGAKTRLGIIDLSEALPLLSSSVPAIDRIHPMRTRFLAKKMELPALLEDSLKDSGDDTEKQDLEATYKAHTPIQTFSVPQDASGELELRNLFAASAPSHRHAWKEGGSAWKMFHRFNPNLETPPAEDDSDDPLNEAVSDSEDSAKYPDQLARSLPIAIQPPFQSLGLLEPKTSLADKKGILVPPLKLDKPKSSSTIRKAIYADRDLLRLVDPGPTLGLGDNEDIEEESPEISDAQGQDRGRRHALSILQAGSTVPEASMWRSLTT